MSLGGGADAALDDAVRNSIASGVTYASRRATRTRRLQLLARRASPRRSPSARRTSTDARASFSNYGTCARHLRARRRHHLGLEHQRHRHQHDQRHVDGHAARGRRGGALPAANPTATPAGGAAALTTTPPPSTVSNPGTGSPNALLYTRFSAADSPVVGNPGNLTGTVGTAISRQMSATGGSQPYTWSATGLPTGLSINASSGLISGTPTAAGTSA